MIFLRPRNPTDVTSVHTTLTTAVHLRQYVRPLTESTGLLRRKCKRVYLIAKASRAVHIQIVAYRTVTPSGLVRSAHRWRRRRSFHFHGRKISIRLLHYTVSQIRGSKSEVFMKFLKEGVAETRILAIRACAVCLMTESNAYCYGDSCLAG
jgi:hypothetical protein